MHSELAQWKRTKESKEEVAEKNERTRKEK